MLLKLPHDEIVKIEKDYEKIARIVRLVYVNDGMPGIRRMKKGKGFRYTSSDKKSVTSETLTRIKKLAIPPAWTSVWICALDNGHIQATGFDLRKRKQYRYHSLWNEARSETKFHKLLEFGKVLPAIRAKLEDDIACNRLSREKVLATIISLMERTYIRVGNEDYEKLYGSYGVTTLKDNHVAISGSEIKFSFTGKKQVTHNISIKNKRLARIVKQCRDIPGKELFQYYDELGNRHTVDSGMVNDYIKEASGGEYSAKDFRTWAGTLNILRSLKSLGDAVTVSASKKNVIAALDEVSKKLGNTRAVCKKYYVHPSIIKLYEENNLKKYLKELDNIEEPDERTGLAHDEKVLMKILKSLHA
ncbi:DNA topoisomerase IB [Pseudochryseolinea flava]|uniref:DNA topoisomerase n=1 Tax=Pseudochryseolinea flava TaxID=2059302 RepID=A0A364Y6R1_9BACT|nr:DNA topoisomerase IB [Pseudochryseolinea flava]RAW01788.1 DNA topoisomerase IB [Pseudochryseolinea flava]